jgi:microcystin-dependent protein
MADPFTAEVRAFGFNFAPVNWAFCNGAQVQIQQNSTLYALLGVTYGGNGTTNFNLPNLQGSTVVDVGAGNALTARTAGEQVGAATVTLDMTTMPSHNHGLAALEVTAANQAQLAPSASSYITRNFGQQVYSDGNNVDATMDPRSIGPSGGSQGHENRQPYLAVNFCICLYGEYPSRP